MLSTDCPKQFWSSIGRISGWRLESCYEFRQATFRTINGNAVEVSHDMAQLLDSLVCALGDMRESSFGLIEAVEDVMDGTRSERAKATKSIKENLPRHKMDLVQFEADLPHLFTHYNETEEDEIVGNC